MLVVVEAESDFLALARALSRHLSANVIATLGGDGAVAVTAAGEAWRASVLPVEIIDTTGAGDAFVGGFAAALASGLDLAQGLRLASTAAGLSCTGFGAQTALPTRAAVDAVAADIDVTRH